MVPLGGGLCYEHEVTLVDISRREICLVGGLDFSTQIGTALVSLSYLS